MSNPYRAPSANLETEAREKFELTAPKKVPAARGWGWIVDGFEFFRRSPGPWILTMVVGFVLMIVLALVPVLGQFVSALTYHVWIGGLMLGCKAQMEGKPFEVAYLFAGFQRHAGKLILLSAAAFAVTLMLMMAIVGPVYLDIISAGPDGPGAETIEALGDPMGFMLRWLVAMALMLPVLMAFWFAPVLIVVNDLPVLDALRLGFVGCIRNVLPFLLYGVILFALMLLAAVPLMLGFLILMPVMFGSVFIAYRDIFTK